jgi:3-phytase/alkaline phosphatase D
MDNSATIRVATFNASLNRESEGQLIEDLSTSNNAQAKAIAEIIQRVNPDVLLVNEFDFDAAGGSAQLFKNNYLSVSQSGVDPVEYPYFYIAPSNTGIASGFDLNNDGEIVTTPGAPGYGDDAFGFGNFPGQFAMVVYSKHPIDFNNVRTFQDFLWKDMPGALLPIDPATGESWYSEAELEVFRLSSKSHWDIPILVNGETVHLLASHPTPPVFDGEEDRNGRRNHDEIRFWADYITPGNNNYIYDDRGNFGGLKAGERFIVAGDQNADPFDGDSTDQAILQLLDNPLVNTSVTPDSDGGVDAANRQGGANTNHLGDPRFDTADFADGTPGNLRVDYVLPSQNLEITDAGVFWPTSDDPLFDLVGDFPFPSSDHRLVWTDVTVDSENLDVTRKSVGKLEFLGEVTFPTGTTFEDTEVGGLSGITYNPFANTYYAISDDRSTINPARFYSLNINFDDANFAVGDVTIADVTTLEDSNGEAFAAGGIDPEGIAFNSDGTVFISSEGDANNLLNPFVNQFSLNGQQFKELEIPDKFLPTAEGNKGIRNNEAFESLTITPDGRYLYTAVEDALVQDGSASTLENESAVRILQYDLKTGKPGKEFLYFTDAIPEDSNPSGGFADNGLVELLAIDNTGTFLALERSFAEGVGNNIRLYEVRLQGATDISSVESLTTPEGELYEVDAIAQKRLLIDFGELGIRLDNSEAMAFGEKLPDGRQSLIVVSDNNFNDSQTTQFLAFGLDINNIPTVTAIVDTPSTIDDPSFEALAGDADDPAIWVNPANAEESLVIGTLKDGGLASFDLEGQVLQTVQPAEFGEIRYNNVDLVYGFQLNNETVDLAIASDRANDTLAIFQVDPDTRQLIDVTSPDILASIFGIDDGEQTAYGLATYTSPVSGKSYVFVSQREGDRIAQLELQDNGSGQVTAEVIRTFTVPIPPDGELEDAQVEGMVVDRELGYLYVGQENFGLWKFSAEPNSSDRGTIIDTVKDVNPNGRLEADVEGLTIYYGADGKGYLLVSSQGDNTFAVYDRQGSNSYLGNFAVDGVEESDGADIINVSLGEKFPEGMLVVQDGSNEPQVVLQDEEEIQNFNTNFKYVSLADLAESLPLFNLDSESYDPRNPNPNTLVNGVASGDTTQTSTVLWARSTAIGDVNFAYSTDPNFSTIAGTKTLTATDTNLPIKVQINSLTPGTDYYYRVTDAAGTMETGQFETAAALGIQAGFSMGVTGDWRGELAPYPAISNVAEKDLDVFVEHGDTIYADIPSDAVKNLDGTRKEQAETLDEYRAKHSEVYDSRLGLNTWGELRASTSIIATIDDHEVTNDFSGGAEASSDPRFETTTGLINDTELYENGLQAFQEYNPIRDDFYGETGEERTAQERKLYRYNTYGSDAATIVLDNRSFRDAPLEGANLADPADIARFLTESQTLDRTMLGEAQLEDLKRDLLTAQNNGITWKFVMVPEPIQNFGPGFAEDRFEGYAKERTEILRFINENNIDNVVFVAADIHGTVVNNLTYQEAIGGEQIATNAFEISTGSVAFDPPFGPVVANLSLAGNPELLALYNSLPVANDADSIVNDKDDFLKQILDQGLQPFGYDPVGLNNNLPIADGLIDATLTQGDYIATHTFGWTEFDIDPETQQLRVTTYGIPSYSEEELLANSDEIISRTPTVVSEFVVNPTVEPVQPERREIINGSRGKDVYDAVKPTGNFDGNNDTLFTRRGSDRVDLRAAFGGNRVYLGKGNDLLYAGFNNTVFGGDGNDQFYVGFGGGDNLLTGGKGSDQFWLTDSDANLPAQANTIADFNIAQGDVIGFANTSLTYGSLGTDWNLRQEGGSAIIEVFGQDVAILQGLRAETLTESNFVF